MPKYTPTIHYCGKGEYKEAIGAISVIFETTLLLITWQNYVICLNKAKTTNFTLLGVKSGAYFFIYRQSVFIAVRSAT